MLDEVVLPPYSTSYLHYLPYTKFERFMSNKKYYMTARLNENHQYTNAEL